MGSVVVADPASQRTCIVAQSVKNLPVMQETCVRSLGREDPLEKGMATHSSVLAWRIPWTEEPGRLQSMGSYRVRHELATKPPLLPKTTEKPEQQQRLSTAKGKKSNYFKKRRRRGKFRHRHARRWGQKRPESWVYTPRIVSIWLLGARPAATLTLNI